MPEIVRAHYPKLLSWQTRKTAYQLAADLNAQQPAKQVRYGLQNLERLQNQLSSRLQTPYAKRGAGRYCSLLQAARLYLKTDCPIPQAMYLNAIDHIMD